MNNNAAKRKTSSPPMGWNSFDSYGVYANERVLLETLDVFKDKLKPAGYEYLVLDAGWYAKVDIPEGEEFPFPPTDDNDDLEIDEYGRPIPFANFFPNGFAPVVEKCREYGIRFGIHIMRGIPRKAVRENTPIKGTSYRAQDIANTDDKCGWCPFNYGVDMTKPGAQEYYDSIVENLNDYGVEYIKADDITPYPDEVNAVVNAIEKVNPKIVLSLSPGNWWHIGEIDTYKRADALRISKDIWDERSDLNETFLRYMMWQSAAEPGFWIDLDMIPFGNLMVWNPKERYTEKGADGDPLFSGKGFARASQFSPAQMRTFMTIRALAASPLMMGGDLLTSPDDVYPYLTNKEIIACNQNGRCARMVYIYREISVLKTERADGRGGWIGVINRKDTPLEFTLTKKRAGLDESKDYDLYDAWNEQERALPADGLNKEIGGDDSLFLRYTIRT